MGKLTLYSYYQSSAAYRVRIALYFKGLNFDYKTVDLMKSGQHEASYSEVNPMKQVPTLVTESGDQIGQSMAIFLWLDRHSKMNPLFPEDPLQMAQVVQFCENINSGIHPIQNLNVRQELEKRFKASPEMREEWCAHWIARGFEGCEKFLARTSKKYCFGNEITAADMFLVPQVFNARRYKVDLSPFPNIVRVDANLTSLDVFKKAHPSVQPDTPTT